MPPGTPYHSFLVEYPYIRVDEFTSIKNDQAKLHLLTHAHSDHIVGLQAKTFSQQVLCSHDTKELLLRHEVYKERHLHEQELRAEKRKTYGHLKVDPLVGEHGQIYYQGSKDLLKVVPLNTPYPVQIDRDRSVTVTLIDANHCPGSVMFLIEGDTGNVLHTGDIRAEPWYLESLKHNPYLKPYLSMPGSTPGVLKTLDAIYLDTACVFNEEEVPTKEDATTGLIALMRLFPTTVHFFLNTWTAGYEDILTAVACAFGSKIHTDRYKHSIYTKLEQEPVLSSVSTRDASSTRFHACERFDRCEYCDVPESRANSLSTKGNRVVYVNPVSTMNREVWKTYQSKTKDRLLAGDSVTSLLVPLARHSPFPELVALVDLFQPKTIVPNTLDPALDNLDWAGIHQAFQPYLCGGGGSAPSTQSSDLGALQDLSQDEDGIDVSLKNLVGDRAEELSMKWVDGRGKRRKLEALKKWLNIIEPFPDRQPAMTRSVEEDKDGYDSSSDVDDEGGRTMHKLFAPQVGIEVLESQVSSSPAREPQLPSPCSSPLLLPAKRSRAPSPSPAGPSMKRQRVRHTPSPLPRSSPSPSSPAFLLSSRITTTPRPIRSQTTPNLKGKGKAREESSPSPIRTKTVPMRTKPTSSRATRPSSLKATVSAPGPSRPRKSAVRVSQESSDHDSDDDDERGITADYLFGGIAPIDSDDISASTGTKDENAEILSDVGNVLEEEASISTPTVKDKTALSSKSNSSTKATSRSLPSIAKNPSLPKTVPLTMRAKELEKIHKENSTRIRMIEQYQSGSPKIQVLQRRDTRYSVKLEWVQGRTALLDQKLKELAEKNAEPDRKRIDKIAADIKRALEEGRRPVEVIPQLECIFGRAESQEMRQLILASGTPNSQP